MTMSLPGFKPSQLHLLPSGTHIPTFAPLNILWFLELFGLQAFAYIVSSAWKTFLVI